MKCESVSFVKCIFVLTTVQGFAVSDFDSKYCVGYHLHTFLPIVDLKTTNTAKLASLICYDSKFQIVF